MNSTVQILTEWGKWARIQTGVPYYVSPSWALIRQNVQAGSDTPYINDDLAIHVDRLIAKLHKRYPEAGTALWNYYRYEDMSTRRLARLMNVSLAKVQEYLKVSEAWIDSALQNYVLVA